MLRYEADTIINATAEIVWAIITDVEKYPEWDTYCTAIHGNVALGNELNVYTTLSSRTFPVNVTVLEENKHMVWASAMPLGLFSGERHFILLKESETTCYFQIYEEFTGLLLPLFRRSIPDMQPVFAEFVQALQARAENYV